MWSIFVICAVVGSTVLIFQFVLTLIGLGGEALDIDVPHDVGHDFGGDVGAKTLLGCQRDGRVESDLANDRPDVDLRFLAAVAAHDAT